jgi:hypothetical protein
MASVPHLWARLFCDGPLNAETIVSLGPAFQWWPQGACAPLAAVHDPDNRQHHWHLNQHADLGRQCRPGVEAKQADRCRYRKFEEVAGTDQGGGAATQCCSPAIRFSR